MKMIIYKSTISKIWKSIRSWQFLYLFLFGMGQLLTIIITDPSNLAGYYLPLVLLTLAFLIKLILLIKKSKITFKHFLLMQLDFASPYVLMVVNIVLLIESCIALDSFSLFKILIPDMNLYMIANSLQFFFGAAICSLLMNKNGTTKMQYFIVLIIIILQAGSDLLSNVTLINSINEINGQISDGQNIILLQYVQGKMSLSDYNAGYEFLSQFQTAIDSAKDFILACIASIISQLLILIDLIARPLQKLQYQQQIYEQLLKNKKYHRSYITTNNKSEIRKSNNDITLKSLNDNNGYEQIQRVLQIQKVLQMKQRLSYYKRFKQKQLLQQKQHQIQIVNLNHFNNNHINNSNLNNSNNNQNNNSNNDDNSSSRNTV